jgi:hypothetical protein
MQGHTAIPKMSLSSAPPLVGQADSAADMTMSCGPTGPVGAAGAESVAPAQARTKHSSNTDRPDGGSGSNFDELARHTARLAIADRTGDALPPRPSATATDLRALFDVGLPDEGRDGLVVIDQLAAAARPGLVGNTGPDFFGWVMGASHPVGVAADWLAAAWGQNSAIYATSPAAAIAEEVVSRWLVDLLRLPLESSVGFATGATMASSEASWQTPE